LPEPILVDPVPRSYAREENDKVSDTIVVGIQLPDLPSSQETLAEKFQPTVNDERKATAKTSESKAEDYDSEDGPEL
jgi:hypothetical protein